MYILTLEATPASSNDAVRVTLRDGVATEVKQRVAVERPSMNSSEARR
jgi:hypothetical protein